MRWFGWLRCKWRGKHAWKWRGGHSYRCLDCDAQAPAQLRLIDPVTGFGGYVIDFATKP